MDSEDTAASDLVVHQVTEYFTALGMFVTRFADVESALRMHCALASGVTEDKAGIVFGEIPVQAAIILFSRLLRQKGQPEDQDLGRALKQLRAIADTRNAILHRGVRLSDDGFVTSDGLPNSRLPSRAIDPELIIAMYDDLAPIMAAMMLARPADYDGWAEWAEGLRDAVRAPWRYTPPQHLSHSRRS